MISFQKASDLSERLLAVANALQPRFRDAFIRAVQDMAREIDIRMLERAIANGDTVAVLRAVGLHVDADSLARLTEPYAEGIRKGALAAFRFAQVRISFDYFNPAVADHLATYRMALIRQVSEETREAIRQTVEDGTLRGFNPRVVARDVRQTVGFGLTKNMAKAVANFRQEVEAFHLKRSAKAWGLGEKIDRAPGGAQVFREGPDGGPLDGIAARRLRDFRFDRTLLRAMREGEPIGADKVDQMVMRYRARWLKHRSEMIARTEALRAANAGTFYGVKQMLAENAVPESMLRRYWEVAADERTCSRCAPVPGLNAEGRRADEPFVTPKDGSVMIPPLHPNCRCTVTFRLRPQVERTEKRLLLCEGRF